MLKYFRIELICRQIGGSSLFGASLWLLGKVNSIQQVVSRSSSSVSIQLMVASAVILVVAGVSGCIGALRESQCMLSTVRIRHLASVTIVLSILNKLPPLS